MSNLVQEWVPTESEVPADHWSKSPEYLAEKAAGIEPPQKLGPEIVESVLAAWQKPKHVLPLHKRVSTHRIAMMALETPYVLTEEDKARIAREKEIEVLKSGKNLTGTEVSDEQLEELAKSILQKVDEAFGC